MRWDDVLGGRKEPPLSSRISLTSSKHIQKKQTNSVVLQGVTVSGYPNMFHLYGPHGPTLLSNGPTTVEVQGRFIRDVIKKMQREGVKYINPTSSATKAWKKRINDLSDISLFPTTKSTYMVCKSLKGQRYIYPLGTYRLGSNN